MGWPTIACVPLAQAQGASEYNKVAIKSTGEAATTAFVCGKLNQTQIAVRCSFPVWSERLDRAEARSPTLRQRYKAGRVSCSKVPAPGRCSKRRPRSWPSTAPA